MASQSLVVDVVTLLGEAFNRTVREVTFEVYAMGLADISDDALKRACKQVMTSAKFMPTVAELREAAGVPSEADRASLAWDAVLANIFYGPYEHVDFDDGTINATIRNLGGWVTFLARFTDAESEKWVRKEFCDTYRSLSRAGADGEMCRPLAGLKEGSMVDGKLEPPKVIRITTGMPEVAKIGNTQQVPRLKG